MWRDLSGIMLGPTRILGCILIVGWAMATTASSEEAFPNVSEARLKRFLRDSHLRRDQLEPFVKQLQSSRQKRSSECPPDKVITEEVINDDLTLISYSPEDLQLCLKGEMLVGNLDKISNYPFTDEQLTVLKNILDKMYPNGYPDAVVSKLGFLMGTISPEDVKKWNITSADTLANLLNTQPTPELAKAIIQRYVDCGQPLDDHALKAIGPNYICSLNETQLNMIKENAIKMAQPLDPSNCSQTTKNILYAKAKRDFSDRHNEFPAYYELIKPYLGGAPGADLKALSKDRVNMDMKTFLGLRNDSIMELKPADVKGLLGRNLNDFKNYKSNPLILKWIQRQPQSELDRLGFGVRGGQPVGFINLALASNRRKRMAFAF